ncbi:MAG: AAA family ATPase [Saprospiraceae bacterium]
MNQKKKKEEIKKKINKYLNDYKKVIKEHLLIAKVWEQNYTFFQSFFGKENLERIEKWEDIQVIGTHIHSFQDLALAKARALGERPNHSIEHYKKVFTYLKYGEDDDNVRFNNLLDSKSGYKLAFFGESSLSELIGNAHADKYVFYNKRDISALEFLGFKEEVKGFPKKFGDKYIAYNKLVQEEILPLYDAAKINIPKEYKKYPKNILLDQFFNWLYENVIFTTDNKQEEFEKSEVKKPEGKITKILIKNFNQFKDFELDLTYPLGHEKEGKPLDKICFIGQSGTGKTTLLNLIYSLTANDLKDIPETLGKEVEIYHRLADKAETYIEEFKTIFKNGQIKTELIKAEIKDNSGVQSLESFPRLMYFPPDIVRQTYLLSKDLKDVNLGFNEYSIKDEILDFRTTEDNEISKVWDSILFKTKAYRIEENDYKLQIANVAIGGNGKLDQVIKNYTDWKDKTINPIEIFSKNLEEFLTAFNVKIALEIQKTNDLQFLRFEPLHENGYEIPSKFLSTGTKQIVLKTLPFLGVASDEQEVAPLNTIILMDEPENSLYPDRQYKLVEHFENLTENCQFFYATHAPIIASTFEPCERFILEFENGFVKAKNGIAPEGIPPNEVLSLDYQTEILQGKAKKVWERYIEVRSQFIRETDIEKRAILEKEYIDIEIKYPYFLNYKSSV